MQITYTEASWNTVPFPWITSQLLRKVSKIFWKTMITMNGDIFLKSISVYLKNFKITSQTIIVLFVGGNDLNSGYHPSVATPQEVFERIESLANTLITVAKKLLYVIGIPPPPNPTRNWNRKFWRPRVDSQSSGKPETSKRIKRSSLELPRASRTRVFKNAYFRSWLHAPQQEGNKSNSSDTKNEFFYKHYSIELKQQGHQNVYECSSAFGCKCGSFRGSR